MSSMQRVGTTRSGIALWCNPQRLTYRALVEAAGIKPAFNAPEIVTTGVLLRQRNIPSRTLASRNQLLAVTPCRVASYDSTHYR